MKIETIDSLKDLYAKYGKYPYACDAVAYYIFGDKSEDNILVRAFKGAYGRHTEVDSSQISEYMLSVEYSWDDDIEMEAINDFIENRPTANGEKLSTYY